MDSVAFKLLTYSFEKASFDLTTPHEELNIQFSPRGVYHSKAKKYDLFFDFSAKTENECPVVNVVCHAVFEFSEGTESIPDFFYVNSIAIIFPYVRAFVSTLTLQANTASPLLLPTLNLSELKEPLKKNTEIC